MKTSWSLKLDLGCFVGQLIAGSFDNDVEALVIALQILTSSARAEIEKSRLPPVQIK